MLAATESRGGGFCEVGHLYHRKSICHAAGNLLCIGARGVQAVGDVVKNRKMRKQCVTLKYGVHRATVGGNGIEALSAHPDLAAIKLFESGDQPKQRGFSRTTFPEYRQKLAGRDVQRNSVALGELLDAKQGIGLHGWGTCGIARCRIWHQFAR